MNEEPQAIDFFNISFHGTMPYIKLLYHFSIYK